MKKISGLVGLFLILSILSISFILAEPSSKNNGVWSALSEIKVTISELVVQVNDLFGVTLGLQEQINNITSSPGPQGEKGEQGPEGLQGPQGPIGPSAVGGSLFYIDASNSCPAGWTQFDMNFNPFGADVQLDSCFKTNESCLVLYQEMNNACPSGWTHVDLNIAPFATGAGVDVCYFCQ